MHIGNVVRIRYIGPTWLSADRQEGFGWCQSQVICESLTVDVANSGNITYPKCSIMGQDNSPLDEMFVFTLAER